MSISAAAISIRGRPLLIRVTALAIRASENAIRMAGREGPPVARHGTSDMRPLDTEMLQEVHETLSNPTILVGRGFASPLFRQDAREVLARGRIR